MLLDTGAFLTGLTWAQTLVGIGALLLVLQLCRAVYNVFFHPLSKIPGPWYATCSSLWLRWHRWHGRLSYAADALLARYGPVVRISYDMVIVNDPASVQALFSRQDLDTASKAIRPLRIGGHDWTVTHRQSIVARESRRPVMAATTTKAMRYWRPVLEDNLANTVAKLGRSGGTEAEEIVRPLRILTLLNAGVVMAGPHAKIDPEEFPHMVTEYNFLVVWRLCLPDWLFEWLKFGPIAYMRYRTRTSEGLFNLGAAIRREAEKADPTDLDEVPTVHKLLMQRAEKGSVRWTADELSAEMAGQALAATETTSASLTFILYELAKNQHLLEQVRAELREAELYAPERGRADDDDPLASLPLFNACISEGLRFRPPVALTGSRVAPKGGVEILGHFIPEGTVVAAQSLSLSRQRPDLFPNPTVFDPSRWLEEEKLAERRKYSTAFGVGARRCPGSNMGMFQMRMILSTLICAYRIEVAPQTTPKSMEPFEANGYRCRDDGCYLLFKPWEDTTPKATLI